MGTVKHARRGEGKVVHAGNPVYCMSLPVSSARLTARLSTLEKQPEISTLEGVNTPVTIRKGKRNPLFRSTRWTHTMGWRLTSPPRFSAAIRTACPGRLQKVCISGGVTKKF